MLVKQESSGKSIFTLQAFSRHMNFNIFIILIPVLLISEWTTRLWNPLGIELYALFFLFSWTYTLGAYPMMRHTENHQGKVNIHYSQPSGYQNHTAITLAGVLVGFIACEITFCQICRHLYLSVGGFSASQSGYWYWLRFGLDSILGMLPANLADTYNLKLSDITATTWWSETFVFCMTLLIGIYVVASLFQTWYAVRATWKAKNDQVRAYIVSGGVVRWDLEQTDNHEGIYHRVYIRLRRLLIACMWLFPLALGLDGIIMNQTPTVPSWIWHPLVMFAPLLTGIIFICIAIERIKSYKKRKQMEQVLAVWRLIAPQQKQEKSSI